MILLPVSMPFRVLFNNIYSPTERVVAKPYVFWIIARCAWLCYTSLHIVKLIDNQLYHKHVKLTQIMFELHK